MQVETGGVTYIGAFLTFRCRFGCKYCINKFGSLTNRKQELSAKEWVTGLNRLNINRDDKVPVTLQGGEPSQKEGWLDIINGLNPGFYIDLLTNLDFDVEEFMRKVPPHRLQRDVPYASIRVSHHPKSGDVVQTMAEMQRRGYSVGLFAVEHPKIDIAGIRARAQAWGIDFRTKEFLGIYKKKLYGDYKYPEAINSKTLKKVKCKSNELLIAPDGFIHRCHRDLYMGVNPAGHLLDDDLKIEFKFRDCDAFGSCNPCDQKIKTDRFQNKGACAVEIEFPN